MATLNLTETQFEAIIGKVAELDMDDVRKKIAEQEIKS